MPETCENWLCFVNSCVYYAHQTLEFSRYCLTQQISKLLGSFEIHWVRQYLVNVVLFGTKDLYTSEMTIKLKINFLIFYIAIKYVINGKHIPMNQKCNFTTTTVYIHTDLANAELSWILQI